MRMNEWVENGWYLVAYSNDLSPGEIMKRTVLNQPLLLLRTEQGIIALEDRCPHRFAPLSAGKLLADNRIQCGYHGLVFDTSGNCVDNPHSSTQTIPKNCRVRAYPVIERLNSVWLWMGRAPADVSLMPDLQIFEDAPAGSLSKPDYLLMDVPFDLIADNLLDLSHAAYLHDGVLGNETTVAATYSVKRRERGITVDRFSPGIRPAEYFNLIFMRDEAPVDHWNTVHWDAPASIFLDVGVTKIGEPRSAGTGAYAAHFLTPETENTTHYHFFARRMNPIPRDADDDAAVQKRLAELRRLAFAGQDRPMIKAQHEIISMARDNLQPICLENDVGIVQWRRISKDLHAQETIDPSFAAHA
jgi:phenylpropionate dioxygenase-like ring-hydroxylating dioxygenase large terminal subunit